MGLRSFETDLETILAWFMRALMLVFGFWLLWTGATYNWILSCFLSFFVSILPALIARTHKEKLPIYLDFAFAFILFLNVAGMGLNFYNTIANYDKIVHFASFGLVAFLGFASVFILNFHTKKVKLDLKIMLLFVIIFTMAVGVVWEFFEWAIDLFIYNFPHEQTSLSNTMSDLAFDTLAGVVVGLVGVAWIKSIPKKELKRRLNLPWLEEELEEEL